MWVQLEILLTGVAIVLGVLTLLWVTSALVSLGFRLAKRFEKPAAAPADSGQPGQTDQAGLPEHHLALIAAAVASVLDTHHRITAIRVPGHTMLSWSRDSRFRHPSSQRVRWDIYANRP
ncbi:MAG: OadG family protein [Alphaproteobacteria bacterium]|jgi:Na+-transporting methylmalonyl-CoA/oxaloacetate decarboxylase gamma subunit|nr:OadG family protein [Alphaproteobacteria bacterium]HJP22207.1 OadG family protein [Alphaproteobacteria bacterium]